jgi:hypothetical protein
MTQNEINYFLPVIIVFAECEFLALRNKFAIDMFSYNDQNKCCAVVWFPTLVLCFRYHGPECLHVKFRNNTCSRHNQLCAQ